MYIMYIRINRVMSYQYSRGMLLRTSMSNIYGRAFYKNTKQLKSIN